jgi:hypothetical protein
VGAAGVELPAPIIVKALTANGYPRPLQIVNFRVVSGGGSVYAGSSITNLFGIAQEWWTLGTAPGPNVLEVRAVDPTTGAKQAFATFTATAVPGAIARIDVTPATGTIEVSKTLQLTATAQDQFGNAITGRPFTWLSGDPNIASVSSSGLVTGMIEGGPIAISASAEGRSANAQVTVATLNYPPDGSEPNNSGASPTNLGALCVGCSVTRSGTIHNLADEDWYQVTIFALAGGGCTADVSRTLTIDLTDIPAGRNYDLELRDAGPGSTPVASRNTGNASEHLTYVLTAPCGGGTVSANILLRVTRTSGNPSDAPYRMTVLY